jgi:hypothetical protein
MPPNPGDLAAPHVLGYMFNWGLYGALVVQTYIYFIAFPNDRLGIRLLVLGVFLLETVQSGMLTHDAFVVFGLGFAKVEGLSHLPLSWFSIPILTSVAGVATQLFFAFRIKVLSESFVVPGLVALLSLLHGTSGIAVGVKSYGLSGHQIATQFKELIAIWLAASAACDVVIALSMTYFLSKRRTGYRSTDVMIARLTRLVIETGTLTAVLAVIVIILQFVPGAFYQFTLVEMIGKLYSNNLLVLLNRRVRITSAEFSNAPSEHGASHGGISQRSNVNEYRLGQLNSSRMPSSPVAEKAPGVHVRVDTWAERNVV